MRTRANLTRAMTRREIEVLDDEALYTLSVAGGDAYAQHCFAERLHPRIVAIARQWVGTTPLAEEVAAEVLRKLMMARAPAAVTSVRALSTVATRNVAMTVLRQRRRRRERRDAATDHLRRVRAEQLPPTPAELASVEEDTLEARLRQCISQLRPEQRATLECFYFEDLGYEAIAARLTIPVGRVRSHLQNGRKRLRHLMGLATG